jgi:hypothetical protein
MTLQVILANLPSLLIVLGMSGMAYLIVRHVHFDATSDFEITDGQGHRRRVHFTVDMTPAQRDALMQEEVRKLQTS